MSSPLRFPDGNWNTTSRRSLSQFNRYAGTRLDVKVASTDALDTVKSKPSRVCPLVCEHGFKADGDKCTKIVCREGYAINDDNACEKQRIAKPATGIAAAASAGRASGGGQIFCNGGSCRPVNHGCHLEYRGGGGPGNDANAEVCN